MPLVVCSGNDDTEAVGTGIGRKVMGLYGGTVGGVDVHFIGYAEALQGIGGFADYRQVRVGAHDDGNFFHEKTSIQAK